MTITFLFVNFSEKATYTWKYSHVKIVIFVFKLYIQPERHNLNPN